MSGKKVLDLGCGARKTPGAVGLDRVRLDGVDVVHDLDVYPYPVETSSFDHIILRHVAEHVEDVVALMDEIHRIGRPGATIEIHVPHFTSCNAYTDPTHKHHFSLLTFDFFCGGTVHGYILKSRFKRVKRQLFFWELHDKFSFVPYHWLPVRWFANHHPILYERFFAFWFPLKEFRVFLEVEK
jgi:SAM-dependent methyltransferase